MSLPNNGTPYNNPMDQWNDGRGIGKSSNPKDRAATSRLDLSLFPQPAIMYGALGMTEGDIKYGGYNYRAVGVSVSTYIAACCRHLFKYYNGEWADPKTKVPHLANALACLAIIVDSYEMGNLVDDRPPAMPLTERFDEFEQIIKHLQAILPPGPPRVTELNCRPSQPSPQKEEVSNVQEQRSIIKDMLVADGNHYGCRLDTADDPARAE